MTPAARRSDALLVVALTAVAIAMSPLAALIVDSGRDLGTGLAIARGEEFPLYGPSLFGTWRPGPVWFYLLAAPLAITKSVGATALFAGVLAAMKIPLAWSLGVRARGAALGLAFAAFVALPGWATLGQLVLSHTMLAEAATLATLWLCLASLQRDSALCAALAAGMLALAVHAHPTTLVVAPAVAWAAWSGIVRPRRWGWLALAGVAFALPFLPAIVAEARSGWPQLAGSAGYFGSGDYGARAGRAGDVAIGATWGQAVFVRDFLLARWPLLAWAVFGGALFAGGVAVSGIVAALLARDRLLLATLLLTAGGWLFVLLLRDATPAWMVYAILALQAGLLALGWVSAWPAAWRDHAARGLAVFALLASGTLLAARIATVRDGVQFLPGASVADIAAAPVRDPPLRFWLPAYAHDALFERVCAAPGDVALHGDLATALHFGQGVAAALHCGGDTRVGFGGQASRTIAGIPRVVAGRAGIAGEAVGWGYVLATPLRVIHPPVALPAATHSRYRVDDYLPRIGSAPTVLPVRTTCGAADVLVVTDLLPGLNVPFEVRSVDGALPPLLVHTYASRYFGCPDSRQFSLDVVALDADATGVFLLRRVPD